MATPNYLHLSANLLLTTLMAILILFSLDNITRAKQNILFLFLEIPHKHIHIFYRKCEKYISTYISIETLKEKEVLQGVRAEEEE